MKPQRVKKKNGNRSPNLAIVDKKTNVSSPNQDTKSGIKPEKILVRGARRVWGTMKETSMTAVKNTIDRLSGCVTSHLKVRRKTRDLPNNRYLWWFVLHDDEERLQMLESAWEKVTMHTNWKIEPCFMVNRSPIVATTPPRTNESNDIAVNVTVSQNSTGPSLHPTAPASIESSSKSATPNTETSSDDTSTTAQSRRDSESFLEEQGNVSNTPPSH